MRITLAATCLADAMAPRAAQATVTLLERLGHRVAFPAEQTCCGQMHINSGYPDQAISLIRHHVAAFDDAEIIVAPSGSCVGSIRHQHAMTARGAGQYELADRAAVLAQRTYELSELLVDALEIRDVGARFPYRVTYHPTCHSLRMLRVGDKPLSLLRHVRDIDLVELPAAHECCGFGGTFALKNSATSGAMLADKVDNIVSTSAQVCSAADSSCLLHIGGGLSRAPEPVQTMHLAEILAHTDGRISP